MLNPRLTTACPDWKSLIVKVTFNLTYNSGTNTVNVGLRSDATGANVNLSNIYNTNTNGVNEVLLTATGEDSTAHLQFQLGGYSNSVNFSATDISVKQLRGQYIGTELIANSVFSSSSNWILYTGTTLSNGKATINSSLGAYATILKQSSVVTNGVAYKLTFNISDFQSGQAVVSLGFNTQITVSANGDYTLYGISEPGDNTHLNVRNGSANFVGSISQISVKEIGGAAVMTNMTTSDIQTDTPY